MVERESAKWNKQIERPRTVEQKEALGGGAGSLEWNEIGAIEVA